MDKFERIEKIKQVLRENDTMPAMELSEKFQLMGIGISSEMVRHYRKKFDIPYNRARDFTDRIIIDYNNGVRFKNAQQMSAHYGCSASHAKKVIRGLKVQKPEKPQKTYERKYDKSELPPVRVNTFAHLVQQLCA